MKSIRLIAGALVAVLPSLTFAKPPAAPTTPATVESQAQQGGQHAQVRQTNTRSPVRLQGAMANQIEGAGYGGVAETGQQHGSSSSSQSIHSLFAHH